MRERGPGRDGRPAEGEQCPPPARAGGAGWCEGCVGCEGAVWRVRGPGAPRSQQWTGPGSADLNVTLGHSAGWLLGPSAATLAATPLWPQLPCSPAQPCRPGSTTPPSTTSQTAIKQKRCQMLKPITSCEILDSWEKTTKGLELSECILEAYEALH